MVFSLQRLRMCIGLVMPCLIYVREPGSCIHESRSEQLDAETQMTSLLSHSLFFGRAQIKEQRAETSVADHACYVLVTTAATALAAGGASGRQGEEKYTLYSLLLSAIPSSDLLYQCPLLSPGEEHKPCQYS